MTDEFVDGAAELLGAKGVHRQDGTGCIHHEVHRRVVLEDSPPPLLALPQRVRGLPALGDVAVRLQHEPMTIRLVHAHVPAVHDDFPAVACRLCQLAAPRSVALYQCLEELRRHRGLGPEKIVADTTGGLVAGEALTPFCPATPVNGRSRGAPHAGRSVSLYQQIPT